MKRIVNRTSYCLLIFIMSISCISQKKLDYIQDPVQEKNIYKLHEKQVNRIKPNDELYISVSSFDDISSNFFGGQSDYTRTGFSNELSVSLISYSVNDSGYIYFPVVGNIYLNDLTLDEARAKLEKLLVDYFNQPIVMLKYAYKKITIIGEVEAPGNYTYSKGKLSIFEALGMAGDLTIHGNRKEVYLLRTGVDSITKNRLDLTKDNILFSQYYYVQPDDIIYVKSRGSIKWSVISVPITLLLTSISTILLIINFVQSN